MTELKPCPFCGSKNVSIMENAVGNYVNIFYAAVCRTCGCKTKNFRDESSPSEIWNRRVNNATD